jgi:general secretion pathway protein D
MIAFKRHNKLALMPISAVLALSLACCAARSTVVPGATARAIAPRAPMMAGEQARINGRVGPTLTATGPIIRQDGTGPILAEPESPGAATESGDISLNYSDADIREILRLILGQTLKLNYSIDPGFAGTVTIHTARPLRREELLPTLQGLLDQIGGTMTYRNGAFRIGSASDDLAVPPIVGNDAGTGTQIIALRYASARQLTTMLAPYVGDSVKILPDPARNVLIVTGSSTGRQAVLDFVRVFDVDYLVGRSYALYPVKTGDPAKLVMDLEAALQLETDGPLVGAIRIVPINSANAIMVIAQEPSYLDRVSRLMFQLDQVKETAGRNIHVYFLKNSQAGDIQPILQRAVNPPGGGGLGEVAPGNLPPTATPARVNGPPAGAAPAAGPAPTATTAMAGATPATQAQPVQPLTEAESGEVGAGNPNGPRIVADRSNNALIIVSTESEYADIEPAIRRLDVLPMEVLIEATIAEVTLNDSLQYGTQFFLGGGDIQGTLSNAISPPTVIDPTNLVTNAQLFPGTLAPGFPGLAVARTVGKQQFAIQALKNITDVQIISAPKLLIMDKQQARLQVGDLVPTITQSAQSVISPGAPVVNSVQYQATGVILTVTPRINSGGLVTLDIEQEVSQVVPTTTSSINSPTFQQRKVQTKVVIQDGDTISLAGLITDKKSRLNSGIPLVQQIPILGALFSTRTNDNERTELLILLTPRVVKDQRDARALTDELKEKLSPSSILP